MSTPFHTFAMTHSGANSGAATPHITSEATGGIAQFPFKTNLQHTQHQQPQQHPHPNGSSNFLATHPLDSSQPPPLDLPPSTDVAGGDTASHSAQLRAHPFFQSHPQGHLGLMHMRAQPLYDPTARTTIASEESMQQQRESIEQLAEANQDNTTTRPHPQPHPSPTNSRIPFPLDVTATSTVSPMQSPHVIGAPNYSAKPSPMLGGLSFSPSSPLLSPQMRGDSAYGKGRTTPNVTSSTGASTTGVPHDEPTDAHDLTRIAKETLLQTNFQRLLSLFIIACMAHSNPKGQQVLMQSGLSSFKDLVAPHLLFSSDPRLRKWTCLALGKCWHGFGHAKTIASNEAIPEMVVQLLMDHLPEVRCAALWSLGAFFGGKILPTSTPNSNPGSGTTSPAQPARSHALKQQARLDLEIHLGAAMATLINDGSPLVRRELMLSLAELVYFQQDLFLAIATAHPRARESISVQGFNIWRAILRGCRDCSSQVQEVSLAIKGYLKGRAILNQSQLGRMIGSQQHPGLSLGGGGGGHHRVGENGVGGGGGLHQHETIEEDEVDGSDETNTRSRHGSISREPSPTSTTTNTQTRTSLSSRGRNSISISDHQSIAHIDADDSIVDDPSMQDYHDRDASTGAASTRVPQGPPIRHFTRFKMGHLRPGAGGGGGSGGLGGGIASQVGGVSAPPSGGGGGGQRRTAEKNSIVKTMEVTSGTPEAEGLTNSIGTGTLDERSNDPMWQVPKSRIFDDAYLSFSEPLLLPTSSGDTNDPPPLTTNMFEIRQTKWRYARSQAMLNYAHDLKATHPVKSSYVEVASLNADWESTSSVIFHPYENMLIAADNHATIGLWNYSEEGRGRLNIFSNDNPPGTKITQLEVVNDAHVSLLLAASDDGVVRIWRGAHEEGRQQLVTAWVANPQPEVSYATQNGVPQTTVNHMPMANPSNQQLDSNVITPSQSYQDVVNISGSAYTPQARLSGGGGRLSIGSTPAMFSGARHSVSTAGLLSTMTPASRSGSLIPQSGSLLPPSMNSTSVLQRSPGLKPMSQPSPTLQATTAAMNIPSYSLTGGAHATTNNNQFQTPTQSPPTITTSTTTTSSRRKQRPPLIVEWQQTRGRLVRGTNDTLILIRNHNAFHVYASLCHCADGICTLHVVLLLFVQIASGNGLETLRIWDVNAEQCINEIPIFGYESLEPHLGTYVTSMNTNGADMAWVGCYDGALRCFDLRLAPIDR